MWLLVTWADGRRERIDEDYEPWTWVAELLSGHFVWDRGSARVNFTAEWLTGAERDDAWQKYGILDEVGVYMAPPDDA